MLFITPNIRATVNFSTNKMEQLFLRYPKLVIRIRIEIISFHLKIRIQVHKEENLDLSTADLDPFRIHQATITQTKLI